MQGKAAISTATTSLVFGLLADAGIRSHFVRQHGESGFIARRCEMVVIEWVTRRVATGSFLKRNPGVKEGYRFTPPKLEMFFKDDEANDPQWSMEQILAAQFKCGGVVIGATEANIMARTTVTVFEVLEKAWASVDCSLIDMKIEFGVDMATGEILLADVIDSDSWRLWPSGDRRLMKDKQVYRELKDVTSEALLEVKRNFTWVMDKLKTLMSPPRARVVVLMGSPSDSETAQAVHSTLSRLGVPCQVRVTSAHKGTEETLRILAEYEGDGVPTVFIAIAGRSNGLGPVLAGNSVSPVINCPPLKADWAAQDIWSSLRLPSGLGCSTVLSPEGAALQAAQIVALSDHVIWNRLRAAQLNTWIKLTQADRKICGENS
ncbi:hypothetical protein NP493_1046g00042 [Ridgeia piscesae]|uniref:PurE domain-containing protein n=1 Tax=Ridgeia piscesae TaxID=27915 RepID=A0AAD9KI95_RIDPI|nr:hypothetical protein NP493_1046g00042 [Ridgeia piscesae]